jgi:hypothetical protein
MAILKFPIEIIDVIFVMFESSIWMFSQPEISTLKILYLVCKTFKKLVARYVNATLIMSYSLGPILNECDIINAIRTESLSLVKFCLMRVPCNDNQYNLVIHTAITSQSVDIFDSVIKSGWRVNIHMFNGIIMSRNRPLMSYVYRLFDDVSDREMIRYFFIYLLRSTDVDGKLTIKCRSTYNWLMTTFPN